MGKESEIDESLVWAAYLDSMEGISTPTLPDEEQALPRIVGLDKLNTIFEWLGSILPGVALAIALALGSRYLSQWIGSSLFDMERSPVSSIMIVILLGMLIRNLVGLPDVYRKGLTLCLRKILRIGIAMLGIRLSILAAGKIGLVTLPVIVVCIVSALFLVSWANKLLGLSRKLGSLIAVGTSICGVSAIIATSSAIDADEDETSYAVTCITIFGMTALLV